MAADIATSLYSWSTTAGSNQPQGSTAISVNLDDNLRQIQTVVRNTQSRSTIASSTTCDLGAVDAMSLDVTGTTTITSFGTVSAGIRKWLTFSGALTLTHNAASLILPSATNLTTAAGDVACFESLGSGNWKCLGYQKANGQTVATSSTFADGTVSLPGIAWTSDTNTGFYRVGADSFAASCGGTKWLGIDGTLGSYTVAPTYTFGTGLTLTTSPGNSSVVPGALTLSIGTAGSFGAGTLTIGAGDSTATSSKVNVMGGATTANNTAGGALSLSGGDASAAANTTNGGPLNLWGGGGNMSVGSSSYLGHINFGYHTRGSAADSGTTIFRLSGVTGLLEHVSATGAGVGPAITSGAGAGATIAGSNAAFTVTFGTGAGTTLVVDLTTPTNRGVRTNSPIPITTFQSATANIVHRVSALSTTSI